MSHGNDQRCRCANGPGNYGYFTNVIIIIIMIIIIIIILIIIILILIIIIIIIITTKMTIFTRVTRDS